MTKNHISLSIAVTLHGLQEASKDVQEAQASLDSSRAVRDDLIREAYDGGISVLKIIRLTNLSREAIYKITHKGRA